MADAGKNNRPSKRSVIDDDESQQQTSKTLKIDEGKDTPSQVVELQQQVLKLEDKLKSACRAAGEYKERAEVAESRLDSIKDGFVAEKKRADEMEIKLTGVLSQLKEAKGRADSAVAEISELKRENEALRTEMAEFRRNLSTSAMDSVGVSLTETGESLVAPGDPQISTSAPPTDEDGNLSISRISSRSDESVAAPVKGRSKLKLKMVTSDIKSGKGENRITTSPSLQSNHSLPEFLRDRELISRVPASLLSGERLIERHFLILGHLAEVFCVAFDRTENYLLTGADDNLVKVWRVNEAMLKFSYRGHSAEIVDLAVSHCNQLVASGSIDKSIRVWRLQNGETLQVLRYHTASITSVIFLPFTGNRPMRYLVTTGNDCIVNIHEFSVETLEFSAQNGLIYHKNERDQRGAKMVTICHSPGGHVLAIGETRGVIRVYRMHASGEIEKMNDLRAHTDSVGSLMWAHSGLRFCSGSNDGTAKIWCFQYGEWQQTTLSLSQEELIKICGSKDAQRNPNSKNAYKVSMVCWTLDDSRIVTTGSEYSFRVWDTNGTQLHKLSLHTDDAFHLCAHPIHSHLILSAGHDGIIAMWDVFRGVIVRKWNNTVEQGELAAILDLSLNRDGTRFAIVDNKGHVSMFGLGANKKRFLRVQFFNTDYSPIVLDAHERAVDEATGIEHHLMPPPKMINHNIEEYGPEIQAMLAGRDMGYEVAEDDLVCPWISRDIVPKLTHNEMESWAEKQLILARMENEEWEKEKSRERPSSTTGPAAVPTSEKRGRGRPRPNYVDEEEEEEIEEQ